MTIIEYESDSVAGIFKITCPVCHTTTTLSDKDYTATIEDSELSQTGKVITIKRLNVKEGVNEYQLDFKARHSSINCDYYVIRAPCLVLDNSSKNT